MDFIAKKGCSQIPKNVKISRRIEEWRLNNSRYFNQNTRADLRPMYFR